MTDPEVVSAPIYPAPTVSATDRRHESAVEKLDRNWMELLRELRVAAGRAAGLTAGAVLLGQLLILLVYVPSKLRRHAAQGNDTARRNHA